jgi:hypothetical protein
MAISKYVLPISPGVGSNHLQAASIILGFISPFTWADKPVFWFGCRPSLRVLGAIACGTEGSQVRVSILCDVSLMEDVGGAHRA